MKARDVMTTDVVSVSPETSTRDIARLLLDHHISAVPVLDRSGAPVGMVSEGDLIGRSEPEREARRDWWLALLAEGEALSSEFLASLPRSNSTAKHIMSRPVVTVAEDIDTAEIARLLRAYRIKRVPVVRDGRVVGIVSRENLLRVLSDEDAHPGPKPIGSGLASVFGDVDRHFERAREGHHERAHEARQTAAPAAPPSEDADLSVADFRRLVADHETKEMQHRDELRRHAAEERRQRVSELIEHHIADKDWRNLLHKAREAAEQGQTAYMLLRFPSQLCSDGGRAINVADADWPATLRGEAAELYLRWETDLKPRGFHLAARVLDFPDGMPGDIGLFLVWRQ